MAEKRIVVTLVKTVDDETLCTAEDIVAGVQDEDRHDRLNLAGWTFYLESVEIEGN